MFMLLVLMASSIQDVPSQNKNWKVTPFSALDLGAKVPMRTLVAHELRRLRKLKKVATKRPLKTQEQMLLFVLEYLHKRNALLNIGVFAERLRNGRVKVTKLCAPSIDDFEEFPIVLPQYGKFACKLNLDYEKDDAKLLPRYFNNETDMVHVRLKFSVTLAKKGKIQAFWETTSRQRFVVPCPGTNRKNRKFNAFYFDEKRKRITPHERPASPRKVSACSTRNKR